jgi:hypothetical protein
MALWTVTAAVAALAATNAPEVAVPEASTYALAGIGLLLVCIFLRRTLRLPPRK